MCKSSIKARELEHIAYLKKGNLRQKTAWDLLYTHRVMEWLRPFDPLLAGTIPLGIDIEGSDLDILCRWKDPVVFQDLLYRAFHSYPSYELNRAEIDGRNTIICRFEIDSFPIEVFGQNRPTKTMEAWRHLLNEFQLLQEQGNTLREEVIRLKKQGMKTEPAFANALDWNGDPYELMLNIERSTDVTSR